MINDGLNDVSIAYRNNLKKNNIHFAKEVIEFIKKHDECYIIVGDFTDFFDNLDHKYLKQRLCDLLNTKILKADYYAIYKNITKYSFWDLKDLLKYHNFKNNINGIRKLNALDVIFTMDEFRENKKIYMKKNKKNGIPQGSSISAVLSNIYMLEIDKDINSNIINLSGIYRRYSDDFIIVLPNISENDFRNNLNKIKNILCSNKGIDLQEEKTQIYMYSRNNIECCNEVFLNGIKNGKNRLSYLGFEFDGTNVTIRDKTVTKYYYKMYRKLKNIIQNNGVTKNGNVISGNELYMRYSIKGAHIKNKEVRSNFITYVRRAQYIFGNNEAIDKCIKRHMLKIRRGLDKVK